MDAQKIPEAPFKMNENKTFWIAPYISLSTCTDLALYLFKYFAGQGEIGVIALLISVGFDGKFCDHLGFAIQPAAEYHMSIATLTIRMPLMICRSAFSKIEFT